MSPFSLSHFIKHLPYTFRFPIPPPFHGFSTLTRRITKPTARCRSISTPSSSSSSTDSFASPYLSARIRCRIDVTDMLSEALLCFGASSISMDEQDNTESADEIYISSIFTEGEDVGVCISHAADSIGLKEVPNYEVTMGEQCDWLKKTQESFHPVQVTEGLWIVPEWRTPPDVHSTNIILNPGLAFGTGDHPTTKLCLLLLHRLIKGGELFLDYGTGSGILAIAAIKLGAALSVGVDIEPQAITSARQNAALNNIGPQKMQLHLASSETGIPTMDETKYDVVIANILLNPLLDLADHIVSCAKPGAVVGVSGIISEQIAGIVERYSELLEGISVQQLDDWACVTGTKKTNLPHTSRQ